MHARLKLWADRLGYNVRVQVARLTMILGANCGKAIDRFRTAG